MPIVSHELMEIAKILGLYKAEINCINILHFTQINQYPTVSINYCDTVSIIKGTFIHDLAKKYRPVEYEKGLQVGIRDMTLYFIGSVYAIMVQQGLIEAEKAGDLSRSGINKALENMVWDFKGLYDGQTFSYSKHTIPMLRLYKAKVKMVEMGEKRCRRACGLPLAVGLTPIRSNGSDG